MSVGDRIVKALAAAGPLCDECLVTAARLETRQHANERSRSLAAGGHVARERRPCPRCQNVRIVNHLPERPTPRLPLGRRGAAAGAWSETESLRARIADHLESHGYSAVRPDGSSRLEARSGAGGVLRICVRGHPRDQPADAARREFAEALLEVVLCRSRDAGADLALALPRGFPVYRDLSRRIGWLKFVVPFRFLWVDARGVVMIE